MNAFRDIADRALRDVRWTEGQSARVLSRARRARRIVRLRRPLLALAAALLLCAATAFAAAQIRRSLEATALRDAREALSREYGLSAESIAFFGAEYARTDSGWRVEFRSSLPERTGGYDVERAGGETRVVWSPEGASEAGVWREEELHAYLRHFEFLCPEGGGTAVRSIGESADTVFMTGIVYAEPLARDIPSAEAIEAAVAALREEMGPEAEPAGDVYTEFVQNGAGERMWCVSMGLLKDGVGVYVCAYVEAESGEIVSIHYESGGYG